MVPPAALTFLATLIICASLSTLHGAADDGYLLSAAHLHARHVDDRICLVEQAVRLFVRLGNTLYALHIWVRADALFVQHSGVAHKTEHVVICAAYHGDGKALRLEFCG